MASSLLDDQWHVSNSLEDLTEIITHGIVNGGMPGWKGKLKPQQIRSLAVLVKEAEHFHERAEYVRQDWTSQTRFESDEHDFALEVVGEVSGKLWAIDDFPDGSIIATQHDGKIWHFVDDSRVEIKNVPKVFQKSQGGLMDVMVHPTCAENGWIYLSYSVKHESQDSGSTTIARGQIKNNTWVNHEILFEVPADARKNWMIHWGSRLVYQDGYVFFSYGDQDYKKDAQDVGHYAGKIHRIHDDGRVPEDNPFPEEEGTIAWLMSFISSTSPTVWSYGHRNPQGLAVHPVTGDLWSTEHGPRGGDEINLIKKSENYGWPLVTHGIDYNGDTIGEGTHKEGTVPPKHFWVPSIAPGGIDFYTGDDFPKWKHNLFVSGMVTEELRRIVINDKDEVVKDEVVLKGLGRVRDVMNGPDGYLYIILNRQSDSIILRLLPLERARLE